MAQELNLSALLCHFIYQYYVAETCVVVYYMAETCVVVYYVADG